MRTHALPSDETARIDALMRARILDSPPETAFDDLAQLVAAGQFPGRRLILVGFSDTGAGPSLETATEVRRRLAVLLPDLGEGLLPQVAGFGALFPIACDDTATGRHMNRRVELWALPDFAPRASLAEH